MWERRAWTQLQMGVAGVQWHGSGWLCLCGGWLVASLGDTAGCEYGSVASREAGGNLDDR